jgi:hypothetical protein
MPDYSAITLSPQYKADKSKKRLPLWLQLFPPMWPLMVVWFVVRIPALAARQKKRIAALAAFAKANNFTYQNVAATAGTTATLMPASFDLPYESVVVDRTLDRITGELHGMSFSYTCASVKLVSPLTSKKQQHNVPVAATFFRMRVPATLPRLYIQPKFGYHRGVKLPATAFAHPHNYVLEGNFIDFYTIMGERDERLDIYMVLSPEVMEALVEHSFYDIWMHDNEITLVGYGAGREQYFAQAPIAFTVAAMLAADVDRIARALRHKV